MRATATSPRTSRCSSPGRRSASRANSRRRSSPHCRRSELVARVEIAGPGFINFYLAPAAYAAELLQRARRRHATTAASQAGAASACWSSSCRRTPPARCTSATAGSRRSAPRSRTCSTRPATRSQREYYINDAGRQMDILAASVWLRYLESFGEQFPFPSNGYRGDYIRPIAGKLRRTRRAHAACDRPPTVFANLPPDAPAGDKDEYIDAVIDRARAAARARAGSARRSTSRSTTSSPTSATTSRSSASATTAGSANAASPSDGAIDHALDLLRRNGVVYEKDGARVVPRHRLRRREGPRRRARERRSRPTSPPTSPIT